LSSLGKGKENCEVFKLLRGKLDSWFYYLNRQQTQLINMSVKCNVQQ